MSLFIEYGVKSQNLAPEPFTQVFTSSQTWAVPEGVNKVDITVIGGGQGGGGAASTDTWCQAGSAYNGGEAKSSYNVNTSNITSLNITIGAGGAGATGFYVGNIGGVSSVKNGTTVILSAAGGEFGGYDRVGTGSGGGQGSEVKKEYGGDYTSAGSGGSDGGKGGGWYGSLGQGTTTRGINDVLYSGGGGGGGSQYYNYNSSANRTCNPGAGGAGGGGAGGAYSAAGGNATANTGGAGGGGGSYYSRKKSGSIYKGDFKGGNGGSGIVIIKWNGA